MKTTFNNLHRRCCWPKNGLEEVPFGGTIIITASNIGNQNIMGALSFICSTSSSVDLFSAVNAPKYGHVVDPPINSNQFLSGQQ